MVEKTFFQTGKFLVGSQPTIADFKAIGLSSVSFGV